VPATDTPTSTPTDTPVPLAVDGQTGSGSIQGLSARATEDPCATPGATSTVAPTMTPTATPTPTESVVQLPSTGQGDSGESTSGARVVLLAAAGLILLATAFISARRRPA
jgi:hypothetical protein